MSIKPLLDSDVVFTKAAAFAFLGSEGCVRVYVHASVCVLTHLCKIGVTESSFLRLPLYHKN